MALAASFGTTKDAASLRMRIFICEQKICKRGGGETKQLDREMEGERERGLNKISLVWITRDASFYAQLLFHAPLLWQGGRGMCRKSHFVLQLLSTLLLCSPPLSPTLQVADVPRTRRKLNKYFVAWLRREP